ncbi:MAG TPA: SURF1 family protein [Methylotenera sp.]|mgnify:FL=1|nr:SURF1 family protein [Methylotenera sp.]
MKQLQFRMHYYVFKPSWVGTLLAVICIPMFIHFGLWQYNKAQSKQRIHNAFNQAQTDQALKFPTLHSSPSINVEVWKYKKVVVTGEYDTKYQFLLDNQMEGSRVGYHVITPLKIDGTSEYVLVNRGWIVANDTHAEIPIFNTPSGPQTIHGQVWVPSKKIFTLESKSQQEDNTLETQAWQSVWQNMNMAQYKQAVPYQISDLVIKLDQASNAGGFVRNWQVPAERITTNLGYAYQWFGFALATLLIYLYMSISRVKPENQAET